MKERLLSAKQESERASTYLSPHVVNEARMKSSLSNVDVSDKFVNFVDNLGITMSKKRNSEAS